MKNVMYICEYDENMPYAAQIKRNWQIILMEIEKNCPDDPSSALLWWSAIEHVNVIDLLKNQLCLAPRFINLARAYLSIQESSAVVERFFGDAAYHKGSIKHHQEDAMVEMLLMIGIFVRSRLPQNNVL